jgi:hypothetical protein
MMKKLFRSASRTIRRAVLAALLLAPALGASADDTTIEATPESEVAWSYKISDEDAAILDKIQRGCFLYFWKEVGAPAELAKDKSSDTISSIAAVGFQLASLPIGVERGWISREEGAKRAVTVLKSLVERDDNKKFGIYLHYVDKDSGGLPDFSKTKYRYELHASTIDHALLQAGAMAASTYFGGDVEVLTNQLIRDANWRAYQSESGGFLSLGWRATTDAGLAGPGNFESWKWTRAGDEERLIYMMGVGSEGEHAIDPAAYYKLERNVQRHGDMQPYVVSWNGSLFIHSFSHLFVNYRQLGPDDPKAFGVEQPRVDWFENSRRAALTHRQRCIEVSAQYPTLAHNRWGLAPCSYRDTYLVHEVMPNLSGQDVWFGGVVPPYGAGSAIVFTPQESMDALREYMSLKDPEGRLLVWRDPDHGGYGLVDSFTLDPPYAHEEYLGIDQGPMLLAIENARTGLVWKLFMQHELAKKAVERLQLKPRKAG